MHDEVVRTTVALRAIRVSCVLGLLLALWLGASGVSSSASVRSKEPAWPLLVAQAQHQRTFYVLTSQQCGTSRCLRLYRSSDIIDSTVEPAPRFTLVTTPPYNRLARTPAGTVMAMVFATANIGYVLEGNSEAFQLFITTNGARSWRLVATPPGDTIWGLTATGTHLYAVFLHCSAKTNGCNSIELGHSSLGATHWSGVTLPFHQFYTNQPLGQLAAGGEFVMFSEQAKRGTTLFISHNGGVSFAASSHASLQSQQGCAFASIGFRRSWAECQSGNDVSLYFSHDAGATWNPIVRHPLLLSEGGFFSPAGSDFAYIDFGEAERNVVRINLGAQEKHGVGTLACRNVESADFMSGSHAYAVCNLANGATELERSIDGGETWHPVTVP